MSDNYTYARPYAEAVFKTALEDSSLKVWGDSLGIMSEVVRNIEIKAILANPKITNGKKNAPMYEEKKEEKQTYYIIKNKYLI